MGSDLYAVRVASKNDCSVTLDVKVIHPDAMVLPADRSFALMMLHEPAEAGAALAEAVGFDDTLDATWMKKYAAGFISSVKVSDVQKTAKTMNGKFAITVTNAAWIAHVKKGTRWESRAFSLISKYDKCAPIAPGQDQTSHDEASDGFMFIPTEIWIPHHLPKKAPAVVSVPAYGEGAYQVVDKVSNPNAKALTALEGRVVRVERQTRKDDGVLFSLGTYFGLFNMRKGSRGMSGFSAGDITSIGQLALKPKARLGDRLSYADVSRAIAHRVVAAKRNGKRVELDIELPPDHRMPDFVSKSQILLILATPIVDDDKAAGNSPLARALREDSKRLEVSSYPELANGYVVSFALSAPKGKPKPPNLDAMTQDEVRAYFQSPRPRAKLAVEVTDAHWLDHLAKGIEPFIAEDNWVSDPIAWTEKPRRF